METFIHTLTSSGGALPQLLVEPEGFASDELVTPDIDIDEPYDPLLDLFRNKSELDTELFLAELRKQRRSDPESVQTSISV